MKDPNIRPKRVCSPRYAVLKAKKGAKLNRWELEDLEKNSEYALKYANEVIKGRFPEAEPTFVKVIEDFTGSHWGSGAEFFNYFFSNEVCDNRIEKVILKKIADNQYRSLECAIDYADHCLKSRWPDLEKKMLKEDWDTIAEYHRRVVKDRWAEYEDILISKRCTCGSNRFNLFSKYLEPIGSRCEEIEKKLMKSKYASPLLAYAVTVMNGRLPQALHQKMILFSFDPKKRKPAKKYARFLESRKKRAVAYLSSLDSEERTQLLEGLEEKIPLRAVE